MFHKYFTIFLVFFAALNLSYDVGWGYLEPYFASYLRSYDISITTSEVHILYAFTQYSQFIGSLLFPLIAIYLGHREGL